MTKMTDATIQIIPADADIFVDFGAIYEHFHPKRHHLTADDDRKKLVQCCDTWAHLIA
jgi:hypothetical protein